MQLLNGRFSSLSPNQLIARTLVAAGIAAIFWVFIRFHIVVLLFVLGFVISAIVKTLTRYVSRTGMNLKQSTVAVYVALVVVLSLFLSLAVPSIAEQSATTASTLTDTYRQVRLELLTQDNLLAQEIGLALPAEADIFVEEVMEETAEDEEGAELEESDGPPLVETLEASDFLETFSTVFLVGIYIVVLLAISFHWVLEGERITQLMLLMVPAEKRNKSEEFVTRLQNKVGSYAIAQAILCLIIGGLSAILYLVVGLPNVLVLALLAGIMEAVPVIGPALGAVPALIVALAVSPTHALWVLVGTIIIQQIENNILVPRVMDRVVGIRPFVTLISLTIFGTLFGLLGAIVSIPLTVIVQLIVNQFILDEESAQKEIVGRSQHSVVRYELQQLVKDIRQQVRVKEDAITTNNDSLEDSLEQIALELDDLLAKEEEGAVT